MRHSVVVIGNFDGVHLGHQSVIKAAQDHCDQLAKTLDERPTLVVVTFWPHPITVFAPDQAPPLLMGLNDRILNLKMAGADEVRVVQFTEDVSGWSPEEFVDRVISPLNPVYVVVGENFRFGAKASGNVDTLRQLSNDDFKVDTMALIEVDGKRTCSTLIRELVSTGEVDQAAKHLGRPFAFRGVVVMGDQRGRELGFPTANLAVPADMVVPEDGVYAGWLTRWDDRTRYPVAISVGSNPTFDGIEKRVESNVLDRMDLELYGVEILVDFIQQLRGQIRFEGPEQLVEQLRRDVVETKTVLTLG